MKPPDQTATATLTTRWDSPTSKCWLVVTLSSDVQKVEFPHDELWKAIQYTLEPFFFPAEA